MIFIISGSSGVGKSFLCKSIVKNFKEFYLPRKHTTRKQRPNEDEAEYFFTSIKKFNELKKQNQFEVDTEIYKNYYGLLKSELNQAINDNRNAIFILDVFLAQKFKKKHPNSILIFVQPANYDELLLHLKQREKDYKEKVSERINLIKEEQEQQKYFDYVIPFYHSEMSFELLKGIIIEKYCRVSTYNKLVESKLNILCKIYPKIAVDIILINEKNQVLIIERWKKPFGFALPGGFVELGESIEQAALRELKEETSVDSILLKQFDIFSNPNRDPRMHVISIAFFAMIDSNTFILNGGDAKNILWINLSKLKEKDLVFDHFNIISKAIKFNQKKQSC